MVSARRIASLTAAGTVAFALEAAVADASTVLSVGGSASAGVQIEANEAAAAAFSLDVDLTNVSISADITCVLTCSGGIFLQQDALGPTTSFGDTLFGDTFPTVSGVTLGSLAAGEYFLVHSVDEGSAVWNGSSAPSVTENGASYDGALFADTTSPYAPQSIFTVDLGRNLHITITGARALDSVVPLPPSGLALLGACAALLGWRKLRQSA